MLPTLLLLGVLILPLPLFILSLVERRKKYGVLVLLSDALATVTLVYLQTVLNKPDYGKEIEQFFFPLAVYLTIFIIEVFRIIRSNASSKVVIAHRGEESVDKARGQSASEPVTEI